MTTKNHPVPCIIARGRGGIQEENMDDLELRIASSILKEISLDAKGKDKTKVEIFVAFSDLLMQLNKSDDYFGKMCDEDLIKLKTKIEDTSDYLKKFIQ